MNYLKKLFNHPSLSVYLSSVSIRALTIGAKFCLTFFLGKEFPVEVLGEYGLFSTSVLLSYFVLSFSFDSYGLREILEKPVDMQLTFVRNSFVFYGIAYLVFLPVVAFIFQMNLLRVDLLFYFLVLLLLETSNQSFFALFTILKRPTAANLVLFFSQGLWIIGLIFLWFFTSLKFSSLENFLLAWIVSGTLGFVYSIFVLIKIYRIFHVEKTIDWKWIRSGLSVSVLLFGTTLSYKLIEFADRYFIEFKLGTSQLGVYVFFSQLANLINTAINVMVILILYPRLMESRLNNDMASFNMFKRKMNIRVLVLGSFIGIVEIISINPLLKFLGKDSFEHGAHVMYLLIISNIVMNLSFIPHYCLYAFKQDTTLLKTTLAGALFSILLNSILVPVLGISGAALSTLLSFSIVLILKSYFLRKTMVLHWR